MNLVGISRHWRHASLIVCWRIFASVLNWACDTKGTIRSDWPVSE